MVVWMLLWEGAVALDELLERVLTPEASDKSLSEVRFEHFSLNMRISYRP